mgnify:CR=1 FL=1|tara:strand:+ start:605 stop:946 length:342 start_codon:yes stop_codon:yes gene_type:complete
MGRYYNGDIEGKFWVAVQSSDSAERFGGMMELSFSFTEDDIEIVQEELKRIESRTPMDKIKRFFDNNSGYNKELLSTAGITENDIAEYADHELGTKILKCLKEQGECNFVGEL